MKRIHILTLLLALAMASCKKELSLELPPGTETPNPPAPVDPQPVEDTLERFTEVLTSGNYRLVSFYSDIPLDFNDKDTIVRAETDLWEYVLWYLKDDTYTFLPDGAHVQIMQNAYKMNGLADEVLARTYATGTDAQGPYLDFLDYRYTTMRYWLHELGDDYFVVYVPWKNGSNVYTRYERLPM